MKHVVITGASAGIGLAAARLFSQNGYRVSLLARRIEKLKLIQNELGENVSIFSLDVSDKEAVLNVFQKIQEIAPIDVLINNAGAAFGLDPAPIADLDDWDKCIDINIKGLLTA